MRSYRTTVERDGKWCAVGPYFDHQDECENWANDNMPSDREWRVRPRHRPPIRYNAWQGQALHDGVWTPVGPVAAEAEEAQVWLQDHREDWWQDTKVEPAMMDPETNFRRKLLLDGDHWVWKRSAMCYWKGKVTTAARIGWELVHGSSPPGGVSRTCDVEGCIRHLCLSRKQRKPNSRLFASDPKKPDVRLRQYQKDEIHNLAREGLSVYEIAEQCNLTRSAVETVIGTARFVSLKESEKREIIKLWQGKQMSQVELAQHFGILKREVKAVIASAHG